MEDILVKVSDTFVETVKMVALIDCIQKTVEVMGGRFLNGIQS